MEETAPVVRCHHCNYQMTTINGPVPNNCADCGKPLEVRPPAVVIREPRASVPPAS